MQKQNYTRKGYGFMIKTENHLGVIELHQNFFSELIGHTVTSCFGVVGMASSSPVQNIRQKVFKHGSFTDRGVAVYVQGEEFSVDIHIVVSYGVNIKAIVDSITNKVRYTVEQAAGFKIKNVNVYVDDIKE